MHNIFECNTKKYFLARLAFPIFFAYIRIIGIAVFDGIVKNRRIRSKSRYRQFIDISLECAAVEQFARDVVEPQTLAYVI